jgi:hypothetical protein
MALDSMVSHIDPVFDRSRILLFLVIVSLLLFLFIVVHRKFPFHRALAILTLVFSAGALFSLLLMLCCADFVDNFPRSLFFLPGLLVYPGVAGILILLAMAVPSLLSHFSQKNTLEAYNALGITLTALLFLCFIFFMEGSSVLRSPRMTLFVACKGNLRSISSALDYYSSEHKGRYPSSLQELAPDYLETIPSCAASGGTLYHYEKNKTGSDFTVWCEGKYHRNTTGSPGFPQYSGSNGIIERPTTFPGLND